MGCGAREVVQRRDDGRGLRQQATFLKASKAFCAGRNLPQTRTSPGVRTKYCDSYSAPA